MRPKLNSKTTFSAAWKLIELRTSKTIIIIYDQKIQTYVLSQSVAQRTENIKRHIKNFHPDLNKDDASYLKLMLKKIQSNRGIIFNSYCIDSKTSQSEEDSCLPAKKTSSLGKIILVHIRYVMAYFETFQTNCCRLVPTMTKEQVPKNIKNSLQIQSSYHRAIRK